MNTKKFSDAMSELDGKYVDEALNYKKNKRPGWIKWGATAACLCLIAFAATTVPSLLKPQESGGVGSDEQAPTSDVVAASGFLLLTAYAASPGGDITAELPSDKEVIMQEGIEVPVNYHWSPAMSSRPGIPLKLSAPEYPDTVFEVSVDGGELLLWREGKITRVESPFNAENGMTIYWTSLSQIIDTQTGESNIEPNVANEAYINIVIRERENIVGYAVVEIYRDDLDNEQEQAYTYYAKLLKSVSFPKVNGTYQRITAEYVETEMDQTRSENGMGQDV